MQPLRVLNTDKIGSEPVTRLDRQAVRARLAATDEDAGTGKRYWRSLEDLARSAGFDEFAVTDEPEQMSLLAPLLDRRRFMGLLGASLALAGLTTGCTIRQPDEKIVPYADQPDGMVLGLPLHFATAFTRPEDGCAIGVLVRSREGRPVKIEGNPNHPSSRGKSDITTQASLLTLYDPDRSQAPQHDGEPATWNDFLAMLGDALPVYTADGGAGLRFLSRPASSPTLAAQMAAIAKRFPNARWHTHDPAGQIGNAREAAHLAFGQDVTPIYRFDRATAILALDCDFLRSLAGSVRYANDFAAGRRAGAPTSNRLYVVEPTPSITGAAADHKWSVAASQVEIVARAVAASLGVAGAAAPALPPQISETLITTIAADLRAAGKAALVIAGPGQPPIVHVLAHTINAALGSTGNTVSFIPSPTVNPMGAGSDLASLVGAMNAGQVKILVIFGSANPVYDAPVDLAFAEALKKVPVTVHHGLYEDETAALCEWHVPEAHYLETWGDARGHDGTATICQPLIAPLYLGHAAIELLAPFAQGPQPLTLSHEIVKACWQTRWSAEHAANGWNTDFETFWRKSVQDGVVAGTASAVGVPILRGLSSTAPGSAGRDGLEIVFRPDPTIGDGYWANNGWLQELPKPLTRLTWDNVVLLSPRTADHLHLSNGDVVAMQYKGRTVRGPVWTLPGQAEGSVTIWLGSGRTRAGKVGNGVGFNANALRTSDAVHFASGLSIVKTGETYALSCVEEQQTMEGRDFVRSTTVDGYRKKPDWVHDSEDDGYIDNKPSLVPDIAYKGHKWGMTIDLNACIGCGTCAIACQAENNIPIVGKEEVGRGRQMHWIRIDRYYEGDNMDAPAETVFQPVPCMHCERAPCELVCPVGATVHDDEGINNMVYNRCVGTRYCSNNCPYKVRRFNWLDYSDRTPLALLRYNPEVTVRTRGVMEKCSYCIQRIKNVEIDAERDNNRPIRDGEIVTACQQSCPTDAIVFGDINDPKSKVRLLKAEPRNYGLLTDLNTVPRTTYLGRIRNPNPTLIGKGA